MSTVIERPIKAVFFDIDGTLTSFTTHTIPQSTIDALHLLRERGIAIFICSGRAPSYMGVVLDSLPIEFDGYVGTNGQYCFDGHGFVEKRFMGHDDVNTILDWLDGHPGIPCNFVEEDYAYFNLISDAMRQAWKQLGTSAPKVAVDDARSRSASRGILQISPYISTEQERELTSLCRNVTGVRWHPSFTDLIPADGGKPEGMRRFLEHHGWDRTQSMAFGDGGNDITMLRYAGIGVAMGDAADEVKAAADYVTDSVDDDGIMNALRHWGVL